MKLIFEQETEIGLCNAEPGEDGKYNHALAVPWPIFVYTKAELNPSTVSLNMLHKCYLRLGEYRVDQPWVRLHRLSHTVFGSEQDMVQWAADLHQQFIVKSVNLIPEQFVQARKAPPEPPRRILPGWFKRPPASGP